MGFGWLKTFFSNIGKVFKPLEDKAVSDFEQKMVQLGVEGIQLVEDAILAVPATLSGTAARDAAIAKFKSDAERDAIDLKNWAVNEFNALIEIVYVGLKPTVAANPATPQASVPAS